MNTQNIHGHHIRTIFVAIITLILMSAVTLGLFQIGGQPSLISTTNSKPETKIRLDNVRDYAASPTADSLNYAVDGGILFYGNADGWTEVKTPKSIIVSAVAIDSSNPEIIYIGAANELVLYRSTDAGQRWVATPLSHEFIGGVTDIAVDSFQRLVYVGTDTAGLFRLRDTGPSLTLSSHLLLDRSVIEVATDSTGAGLAFARTEWDLYRTGDYGINWSRVDDLATVPTALTIANTAPATVYLGTVDRGILKSKDGISWSIVNQGLGTIPGSRLMVDALAVDPMQPETLYAATSYLFGSTTVHQSAAAVFMNLNSSDEWSIVSSADDLMNVSVTELLPISGETGAVYALTMQSRSPLALGNAPIVMAEIPVISEPVTAVTTTWNWSHLVAWVIAGLALCALLFAITIDVRRRRGKVDAAPAHPAILPSLVRNDS